MPVLLLTVVGVVVVRPVCDRTEADEVLNGLTTVKSKLLVINCDRWVFSRNKQ